MATTRKRKATKKAGAKASHVKTTSFTTAISALEAGKDVVLFPETKKRGEVRVRPTDLLHHASIGKFGFLVYSPSFGQPRVRSFVDDQDIGCEHYSVSVALIHAVTNQAMSEFDLSPRTGGFGQESIPVMADAVCRMLGVTNR
jgi:hypothetical protein